MMQSSQENQQLLQTQFKKCQEIMYQNYLKGDCNLS